METKAKDVAGTIAQAMGDSTIVTRKTRLVDGAAPTETRITIKWDSPQHEREFAARAVVIATQAMMRAAGDIPAELTVSVSELAKRERGGFAMKATPANAQRLMGKLDDAQYGEALAAIGITPAEVRRLVAARVKIAAPTIAVVVKPTKIVKAA